MKQTKRPSKLRRAAGIALLVASLGGSYIHGHNSATYHARKGKAQESGKIELKADLRDKGYLERGYAFMQNTYRKLSHGVTR
jgi:hypothetical protein|tara:strand:+ start:371 stop:616 length:246 start_codon:yes stop_codon:yes gene_type:complete